MRCNSVSLVLTWWRSCYYIVPLLLLRCRETLLLTVKLLESLGLAISTTIPIIVIMGSVAPGGAVNRNRILGRPYTPLRLANPSIFTRLNVVNLAATMQRSPSKVDDPVTLTLI